MSKKGAAQAGLSVFLLDMMIKNLHEKHSKAALFHFWNNNIKLGNIRPIVALKRINAAESR